MHVIVLGIDPGVANTGYGIVAHDRGRLVALDGGVIETRRGADAGRAAGRTSTRASASCSTSYQPDAVAVEDLYFGTNARSAFAVGQARGVVMLAAGQRAIRCASYTPQQVKAAVCGSGKAGKEQVQRMVQTLLALPELAEARPRRRRARRRDLPRQRRAAGRARSRRSRHDRAGRRRGRDAARRPRGRLGRRRRLPAERVGRDARATSRASARPRRSSAT